MPPNKIGDKIGNKSGVKLPYSRKNPFDRHGAEAQKLPDHELRTKGLSAQVPVAVEEPRFGNIGEVVHNAQLVNAQKALGQVADAPIKEVRRAGAKTALAGMGLFGTLTQKVKRGTLVALLGITALQSTGALSAPTMLRDHAPPTAITRTTNKEIAGDIMRAHQVRYAPTRALSDAQEVLRKWSDEMTRDVGFEVTRARASELVAAALLPDKAPAGVDIFTYAKGKLGTDTRDAITSIVDGTGFKLAPDARDLLALSLGRVQAVSTDGLVTVTGDQAGGVLRLKGPANAQVEVLNLSRIPNMRIHPDETFVLGNVRADGTFEGALEMQEGDIIRLRLKAPDGRISEWVDLKATGVGADARQAEVALFRIGLKPAADGTIAVTNINPSRPVSEPGAVMRFVNERTGAAVDVTFDKNGSFPANTKIEGKAGDKISIRVTDGVHDKELAHSISVLTVRDGGKPALDGELDLKDPTLHSDEIGEDGKPKFSLERYRGPLFELGAQYTDAVQGQIGDCYFPAAVSAIAFHVPGHFEKMMQMKSEIDEITGQQKVWYEVTFKERDHANGGFKDVVVKVDGDLYIRSWGGPLYGADDGARTPEDMELWFAILEKAYAQWKGESYESIGNGGWVNQVFEDMLGVEAGSMGTYDAERVWKTITSAVDDKRAIGAGTRGESDEALYANTGVYANHAYSILGYEEADGVKYVKLRNPWGESEPSPGDGKNDGIFRLTLDQFQKLYAQVYFVEKP